MTDTVKKPDATRVAAGTEDAKRVAEAKRAAGLKPSEGERSAELKSAEDKRAVDARRADDTQGAATRNSMENVPTVADSKPQVSHPRTGDAKAQSGSQADAQAEGSRAGTEAQPHAKVHVRAPADPKAPDSEDNTAKASALLAQLQKQVQDKQFELAEATLAELDALKGSHPNAMMDRIEAARSTLLKHSAGAK